MHLPDDLLTVSVTAEVPPLTLSLRQPRAVTTSHRPDHAARLTRCATCGKTLRASGEMEWIYHDDDRTAAWEDGFVGVLRGTCGACGTGRRLEVRLTLEVSRADDSGELTWLVEEDLDGPVQ